LHSVTGIKFLTKYSQRCSAAKNFCRQYDMCFGNMFTFQQDSPPAHRTRDTIEQYSRLHCSRHVATWLAGPQPSWLCRLVSHV